MWLHVVRKFSTHPIVIGCDFMNEPYTGIKGDDVFWTLLDGFADVINKVEYANKSEEDIEDEISLKYTAAVVFQALGISIPENWDGKVPKGLFKT